MQGGTARAQALLHIPMYMYRSSICMCSTCTVVVLYRMCDTVHTVHYACAHSWLQAAETVKLVGRAAEAPPRRPAGADAEAGTHASGSGTTSSGSTAAAAPPHAGEVQLHRVGPAAGGGRRWSTHSVATLQPGVQVLVLRQAEARHTGRAVEEFIVEK